MIGSASFVTGCPSQIGWMFFFARQSCFRKIPSCHFIGGRLPCYRGGSQILLEQIGREKKQSSWAAVICLTFLLSLPIAEGVINMINEITRGTHPSQKENIVPNFGNRCYWKPDGVFSVSSFPATVWLAHIEKRERELNVDAPLFSFCFCQTAPL